MTRPQRGVDIEWSFHTFRMVRMYPLRGYGWLFYLATPAAAATASAAAAAAAATAAAAAIRRKGSRVPCPCLWGVFSRVGRVFPKQAAVRMGV